MLSKSIIPFTQRFWIWFKVFHAAILITDLPKIMFGIPWWRSIKFLVSFWHVRKSYKTRCSFQLTDKNAIVLAKVYFPEFISTNMTIKMINDAIKCKEFWAPKVRSLNALLAPFGHDIVKSKQVTVCNTCKLRRADVITV